MGKQGAFTLVEMMITLTVMTIFVTLAVQGYYALIQNNRSVSLTNNFVSSFQFARTEAVLRGQTVSVCPAGDTTYTSCGGVSDWDQGWIVFVDPDSNGVLASDTDRLRIHEDPGSGTRVESDESHINYDSNGFVVNGSGDYTLSAAGCSGTAGRTVNINNTGRLSVSAINC